MDEQDKEQIRIIRKAARVVFPAMPGEFKDYEWIAAVKEVMGHGYVSDASIMRRLRELFSEQYKYFKKDKVYRKNEMLKAA